MKFWFKALTLSSILGITLFSPIVKAQGDRDDHKIPLIPSPLLAQLTTATPSSINGKIDSSSNKNEQGLYYNVHTLEGKAGEQITIDLTSSDFYPYLIIFDSEGNKVGEGYTRIIVTLPKDSTYGIVAIALQGKTGNYTLNWHTTTKNDLKLAEAEQLNQQIIQLYKQGKYAGAIPLAQRALAIREEVLGAKHLDTAGSLNNLALLYKSQGNYSAAEPLYLRALAISEEVLGAMHPNTAISLNNLAELYREQGNYKVAEPLYKRALAIVEEVLGAKHPDTALSLNNLALLYEHQGNYKTAEPLYQRALAIREEVLGAKHPDTAGSLNNLAQLYKHQGNYSTADLLFRRAINIYEEVLGAKHPDTANALNNLAELYQEQGNYTAAEPLYQSALAIVEEVLGAKHPYTALLLNDLAGLYRAQGNYIAAEPLLQKALAIQEEVLGAKHPYTASSLNDLALLYRAQGNYKAAEPLLQRALAIDEEVLGAKHPNTATALNNLAALYQDQGNYAAAEPLYQKALAMTEEVLGAKHSFTAISLNNLALLYQAQGNIPLALDYLTRGTDIEEYNLDLNLAIGSERQKQDYIATISRTTDATISLHLQDAPDNPEAARLALTTLLRRKARILDVLGDSLQTLRGNLTPESQKLLDELIATRSQLAALLYNPPKNLSSEQYKAQFNNLKTQEEQLEATLARKSAEFRRQNEPVTIEAVQKLIPADAILVEIVLYQPLNAKASQQAEKWGTPRYAAYILNANGQIQWVDLGEAEPIDNAILAFRDALQKPSSNIKPLARNLDEKLMQPIRQKLGNTRHILLSPDSQLNLIPFTAFVDENDQYLIENYTITYLTTGRDLIQIAEPLPSQQSPVILANPDFDTSNPTTLVATKERGTDNRRSGDITSLKFGSLPGTKLEADAISKLLSDVTLLTKSQATENALKGVKSPQILHLATHGFFLQDVEMFQATSPQDDRGGIGVFARPNAQKSNKPTNSENPLLRSGIALAGFNLRSSSGEDGVLTALEATSLNLQGTKLVVLSACETGVGDITNGEGVYGLRRAFVLAGSESQVFSLWKVDDAATKDLMVQYYQRILKGEERSEGMRQTQLEMLASSNRNHPYYWAAFLPSGDWRAMK